MQIQLNKHAMLQPNDNSRQQNNREKGQNETNDSTEGAAK